MNGLMVFNNAEFGNVRTMEINGEPWFVGKDVCNVFGDSDHKRSLSRIDDEEKTLISVKDSYGRSQTAIAVNESGLYSLLFQMQPQKSNKKDEGAHNAPHVEERINKLRKFKHWVTSEILPTIRKTGTYSITQTKPDSYMIENPAERARRWAEEYEERLALEQKNTELSEQNDRLEADNKRLTPMAKYARDIFNKNTELISIDMVGRELGLNKSKLHMLLKEVGVICSNSGNSKNPKYVLSAKYSHLGETGHKYFMFKTYPHVEGRKDYPPILCVTEKGRGYIHKHFEKWVNEAYGDNWREVLWSKAQIERYNNSNISDDFV